MVVLKFGGTSVGSVERIRHVASRIEEAYKRDGEICVVASAMSGETNRLVSMYKQISEDEATIEYDLLLASGEQASISLLSACLRELGLASMPLLGFQAGFLTDEHHSKAKISRINPNTIHALTSKGIIPIVAGFQGADRHGHITTLGRGGSDTSAVALAAALQADRCDIFTDVSGVYSADPRVCSNATRIQRLSFEEMMELASLGAKVLHPRAVEIGAKYKIPIRVLNTFEESEGTLVSDIVDLDPNEAFEAPVVTALTTDHNLVLVTLKNLKHEISLLDKVFGALAEAGTMIDIIVHSAIREDGSYDLSFSGPKEDSALIERTLAALQLGEFSLQGQLTKVSMVGSGMRSHTGVAARVFRTLARENIAVVCTTTSEIKISCVVESQNAEKALVALHNEFKLKT